MALSAKRRTSLFVQAAFRVFAFLARPSASHGNLQKKKGAEAPDPLDVFAHGFLLNLTALGRRALEGGREGIGFDTAASLASLAASMMLRSSAVDSADMLHMTHVMVNHMAAMLALGATATLGAQFGALWGTCSAETRAAHECLDIGRRGGGLEEEGKEGEEEEEMDVKSNVAVSTTVPGSNSTRSAALPVRILPRSFIPRRSAGSA